MSAKKVVLGILCVCVVEEGWRGGGGGGEDVWDILEGYRLMMLCCEYYSQVFCQVLLSSFLNMSYFTSEDKTPACQKLEKKRYNALQKDDIN